MLLRHAEMFPGKKPKEEPKTEPVADRPLTEFEEIAAWRYLMLLDLKFTPDDALHLLMNPRLDWHQAKRLIDKGCSHELVIRILEA